MSASSNPKAAKQSHRFLYLYALAVAGGAVAYVPFLTILLPNQASRVAGEGALPLLAHTAFAGAIAASLANIFFGWASDKSGARRRWILAGLVISTVLLPCMQLATSPTMLVVMIVCWQLGLNMMLGPLSAWAGDTVPDAQKGLLGGLLAFAPALGAVAGALVTFPGFADAGERPIIVATLVVLMVAPVLVAGRPLPMPLLTQTADFAEGGKDFDPAAHGIAVRMWLARLFVQIAEASLFAFLLLWFRSVAPEFRDNDAANIFMLVLGVAVVFTLLVGRWSDRVNRPIFPLGVSAGIAAAGLLLMSAAESLPLAIAGYIVFGLSSSIFLALHASQTLRVLPSAQTRGRDLGLFNLTNTVPSLIMPWLTLALVPAYGFGALFLLLAALAVVAAIFLFTMPRRLVR